MNRPEDADGPDFEALRLCIERCDPDLMHAHTEPGPPGKEMTGRP